MNVSEAALGPPDQLVCQLNTTEGPQLPPQESLRQALHEFLTYKTMRYNKMVLLSH